MSGTGVHAVVVTFLSALVGSARPDEFVELRYHLEDGERMGQLFESTHRLPALATRAIALSRHTDVYVGCAPRTRRAGGRDSVDRGWVVWADCDGEDAARALEGFKPAPSIVIASGSGANRHAYWRLDEPVRRPILERANRQIARALGADLACADAARILRPPGTFSYKHAPPVPVRALCLDAARRVSLQALVGDLLPEADDDDRRPPRAPGNDPLLAIAPEIYVTRLLGVAVPSHRKVPCPFHPDDHPSLHVYETAARGWFCFGRCRRGGSIYDLAAPLFGYELRGEGFLLLRAELRRMFGVTP
jgi:hypothetical protein